MKKNKKKTVLIVDDLAFVRTTLNELLTEAGYRVVAEAADGEEAIGLWEEHRPDLVTMDVVMPKLGGIDATKAIMERDPTAKIVMISSMDQVHLVMEAIHVGAKDYIQKPFYAKDVTTVLERTLNDTLDEQPQRRARPASRAG